MLHHYQHQEHEFRQLVYSTSICQLWMLCLALETARLYKHWLLLSLLPTGHEPRVLRDLLRLRLHFGKGRELKWQNARQTNTDVFTNSTTETAFALGALPKFAPV
jgi:hypothetical protein